MLHTIKKLCKGPLGAIYCNFLPFTLVSVQPQQTMMSHCLLALAKVFCGLRMHESRVLQDGMHLYGQGMRMLKERLDKAECRVTTEMTVSVVSLCVSEVRKFPRQLQSFRSFP